MSKHTPGPWKADGTQFWTSDGEAIGEVYSMLHGGFDAAKANARLIAAAPDLLKALDAIVQRIYEDKGLSPYSAEYRDALNAIANATGKQ